MKISVMVSPGAGTDIEKGMKSILFGTGPVFTTGCFHASLADLTGFCSESCQGPG